MSPITAFSRVRNCLAAAFALVGAICVQAASVAAQAPTITLDTAVRQVIAWSYNECRPDRVQVPPPPRTSSYFWQRNEPPPPPLPLVRPRLLSSGFASSATKLSEQIQERIQQRVEQVLANVSLDDGRNVELLNMAETGTSTEFIRDIFSGKKGEALTRGQDQKSFDLVLGIRGDYARGGAFIIAHLVVDKPDGGCIRRTFDIAFDIREVDPTPGTYETVIDHAVGDLFKDKSAVVKRVAILPATIGTVVMRDDMAATVEKLVEDAVQRAAAPTSGSIGADRKDAAGITFAHLRKGVYLPEATKAGDWIAQIRFVPQQGGNVELNVDFFDVGGTRRIGASTKLESKLAPKEPEATIAFPADVFPLFAKKDFLAFQVKVLKPAWLFCLHQEADGEAALLYPNHEVRKTMSSLQRFSMRTQAYAYPRPPSDHEIGSELAPAIVPGPVAMLVRCFATPDRPFGGEIEAWLAQTPGGRAAALPPLPPVLTGEQLAPLLASLRKLPGLTETLAVLHFAQPQ